MKQYFILFLVIVVLSILGWLGYKYRNELYNLKNFFNFKCVDISKLEQENEKKKNDISLLMKERDLLKPLLKRQKVYTDSLLRVDSIMRLEILKEKEITKILERRLTSSKDSVRKYRLAYSTSVRRYEDMKKNQKKPSNEQTLDFFKKY